MAPQPSRNRGHEMNKPLAFRPGTFTAPLTTILLAGVVATGVWEIWARAIMRLLTGSPLQTTPLIKAAIGTSSAMQAELLHILIGLFGLPYVFAVLSRLAAQQFRSRLSWPVCGLAFGLSLGGLTHFALSQLLVGGAPDLAQDGRLWASLAGQALYGLALAGLFAARRN